MFDGTLPEHVRAAHLLSEFNVQGTFFAYAPNLLEDISGWRRAIELGHEIGNHALYGMADRDGLLPQLESTTVRSEVEELDTLLDELGVSCSSIASPMVGSIVGEDGVPTLASVIEETIVKLNAEQFADIFPDYSAARGALFGVNTSPIDCSNLQSFPADDLDGDSLCVLAQVGISQRAWTILTFGGAGNPVFDENALRRLLVWLDGKPIWVAPINRVVRHLTNRSVTISS
ncbi:MAG: hypothetical protein ABL949_02345 [Fimbriimonadaceae bacterium]